VNHYLRFELATKEEEIKGYLPVLYSSSLDLLLKAWYRKCKSEKFF